MPRPVRARCIRLMMLPRERAMLRFRRMRRLQSQHVSGHEHRDRFVLSDRTLTPSLRGP